MSTELLSRPMPSTAVFVPELVYFEPDAMNYPKGQQIYEWAKQQGLDIHMTTCRWYSKNTQV
jgi:spore photoproduct lyase